MIISAPAKFLLVDDTEQNLVALEALLRRDGLELLKASNGKDALELLLVHEVALALIDVQMPEMDGFELAELMRGAERTKHVPIIFVTAGSRDPHRVFKGYETGAVDFLFKPIDPHMLKTKADVFFELYRQRQELSSSLHLSQMFVGILGHDLRNPLAAMLTGAQLLTRQLSDEKQLRTLQRMTSAGKRMTDMIDQLLDLTRAKLADGLGFARVRRRVHVGELVQRTVDELRGAHPEKEVMVESLGACTSSGDADRLLQLFSNLIANAFHHGVGGSAVSVAVDGSASDREILVRVRNKGAIPAELLPSLFDPFRGRQRTLSKSGGLGLGLFICQQIALAHGGSVGVESSEGTGTTIFTVRLPRASASASASARRAPQGTARTVLIVDDDEHIRDSLREAFEEEGYQALTAANGREALAVITREPAPDVIILDLVLPVMDGDQVYRAMQADPLLAKIPVIVSTLDPARDPTGVTVVPKPLQLHRLIDAVDALWPEERQR